MPAAVTCNGAGKGGRLVAAVMIGVDPHKGSRTALAIDAAEEPLGQVRVAGRFSSRRTFPEAVNPMAKSRARPPLPMI